MSHYQEKKNEYAQWEIRVEPGEIVSAKWNFGNCNDSRNVIVSVAQYRPLWS